MRKLLLILGALAIGAAIFPAALWLGDRWDPDWGPSRAQIPPWKWSDDKARLQYCVEANLADFEFKRLIDPAGEEGKHYTSFVIRTKGGAAVYSNAEAHEGIVFTRFKQVLFVTDFHSNWTGCSVAAIDLSTGRKMWSSRLRAIPPTTHSRQHNRVNIETDGRRIIVYGNESHGRYVEILDINTGKTLANQTLDPH